MAFPLDHIVVYAADPENSGRFYTALMPLLGFEKYRDHVFSRDGMFFDIRAARGDGFMPRKRDEPGVDHIGFRAIWRADVDRIEHTMRTAGYNGRLIEFASGDYALFLPDPDGVRIEITCYASPAAGPVD